MPWDLNDYPNSMKNMHPLVRKKAIDIANALEEEGYEDDRAIPIAQSQAQEWYDNASVTSRISNFLMNPTVRLGLIINKK